MGQLGEQNVFNTLPSSSVGAMYIHATFVCVHVENYVYLVPAAQGVVSSTTNIQPLVDIVGSIVFR